MKNSDFSVILVWNMPRRKRRIELSRVVAEGEYDVPPVICNAQFVIFNSKSIMLQRKMMIMQYKMMIMQ